MSRPLFVYELYCETCDKRLTATPQAKVVIEELRRLHAQWHERILREATEEVAKS